MSPKTGSHSSMMALWNTWPPSSSGATPEAAAVARPIPSRVPALDRRGLAQFEAAAGQVADRQGQPGRQTAGEAAAGKVVAGQQQVDGEDDHRSGRPAG